jgi:hypothetical protein
VRGRVRGHLLEAPASATLAVAAPLRSRAGAVEALDQVVADPLELDHVGHVALGAK